MYGIMLTVHDEKCYECMIWIFGGMNEWENGLLTMQCIKIWKYGRMLVKMVSVKDRIDICTCCWVNAKNEWVQTMKEWEEE